MPYALLDMNLLLPKLALVLMRISGLFLTAPVFGSRMIPVKIRIAMALALSFMVVPMVDASSLGRIGFAEGLVGASCELAIGAAMGLSLSIVLGLAELAGFLVGQQAGLALGQVVDPTQNAQASVIGQVYTIVVTVLFLLVGGLRAAILALLETYRVIPLLSYRPGESVVLLLVESLAASAMVGFRLAAPVMIALLLVLIGLSVLSRTMPQLNILSVGFSLKVLLALGAVALVIAESRDVVIAALWDGLSDIRESFGLPPTPTGLTP